VGCISIFLWSFFFLFVHAALDCFPIRLAGSKYFAYDVKSLF
jgi:hypothetical protein